MTDDLDVLEFVGTPNCARCLHPMTAVVGRFWCESCRVAASANSCLAPSPTGEKSKALVRWSLGENRQLHQQDAKATGVDQTGIDRVNARG